ncbi:hypothetical protein Poli38472_010421 [Pythium oligandrum]|uniref:Uncharacterized protein n=1 Tax=Pythium oligandrum TaxID=41045 RepID=A0A8K1C2Z8_PYTOL|nr:hypothetical protein Poli38472_010421 [Pythium oligandrum]|eukprot:TMW55539.1 hypothetical protein Poli38472_010421 [Pythium oligandrum]
MHVLLCAIAGSDVILSVSVEDEMINAEFRHAIMLAAQLAVTAHTLELWLARIHGRLVVGLPTYHPDYRGVMRGDTVVASKYFVDDNRLDPAARVAQSFRYANPHSIHVLLHLPDRVAAPYVIKHGDKGPDWPVYLQLLVFGLAFPLFVPYQEEKLVNELKDELLDAYPGFSSTALEFFVLREDGEHLGDWMTCQHPHFFGLKKGEANLASLYTPEALRMDFTRTLGHYLANAPLRDGVPVLVKVPVMEEPDHKQSGTRTAPHPTHVSIDF